MASRNTGEMMEYDIRTALMVISAIAIFAILLHGLWKIRKNKNPYKLKTKVENVEPLARNFDGSGFDQDGVSQPKVVGANALTGEIDNPPQEHEIAHQPAPAPEFNVEPLPKDIVEKEQALAQEPEILAAETIQEHEITQQPIVIEEETTDVEYANDNKHVGSDVKSESQYSESQYIESEYTEPEIGSIYDTPITSPKAVRKAPVKKTKKKSIDQIEINFGDELKFEDDTEPKVEPAEPTIVKKVDIEPEVIVLSVVMPEDRLISGAALLPTLLTLGMKYGDMNIFHRHEDNAGNGKITFSLANMMNPGTFDLDEIESFSTQGVTLFMTLPNPGDAFKVFEQMLAAAKQLTQEFHGQLLDDKRSVMTKQTEQHYISKIREFDRKYRIAAS